MGARICWILRFLVCVGAGNDRVDKGLAIFDENKDLIPDIVIDGKPTTPALPAKADFDGILTLTYPETAGMVATRTLYPSMTKALVLDEWHLRNTSEKPVTVSVKPPRIEKREGEKAVMIWQSQAVETTTIAPKGVLAFHSSIHARLAGEPDLVTDPATERAARQALVAAAWNGPGRLETPDRDLNAAYALQKFHVLETPIETHNGVITHNGSLTYSPGIWANDPVEYSSPLFPFFGDPELNKASMQMYRIWLDHCLEHGIDPFPGSFEHAALKLTQKWRGDDAMVLYGLAKFLLFQGDRAAAEEMWPLIEFSAGSVQRNTRADGIVATGLESFECTPWLPKDWPRMALRDVRAFGRSWDLVLARAGDLQKVTVSSQGRNILSKTGPAGKTYRVNLAHAK
jgi:hypothetical protein